MTWKRVITSEPVDALARIVTSPGPRYEVCSNGWESGAFSRVFVPFDPNDRMTGKISGRMVVLGRRIGPTWKGWTLVCQCNCGNFVIARARHIRHQSVRMCGECEVTRVMCGADRPDRVKKDGTIIEDRRGTR